MPARFEAPALPSLPRSPAPTRFTPRTPSAGLRQPFPSASARHSKRRGLFANSQADPADGLRSEIRFERFETYLEAWFSPRRFRRSRRRRCSGVGVLGLNATRYHSGWLRSLLSQVNVEASAFGCRATFSRIAPYGCFASLFSVLALARGCSLIRRNR